MHLHIIIPIIVVAVIAFLIFRATRNEVPLEDGSLPSDPATTETPATEVPVTANAEAPQATEAPAAQATPADAAQGS